MTVRVLVPPMLATLVQAGILAVDGHEFSKPPICCPECAGALSGYDSRVRRFALVTDENGPRAVDVTVRRFRCGGCGRIIQAVAPFYPDTRLGAPIVDLCRTLSLEMPVNRAARVMEALGIVVDRGTVRNYAARDFGPVSTTSIFGLTLPSSVLSLSLLALRPDQA